MKKYVIMFYTKDHKAPEFYNDTNEEMSQLFTRIAELTKHKAKFVVYAVGDCLADFS